MGNVFLEEKEVATERIEKKGGCRRKSVCTLLFL